MPSYIREINGLEIQSATTDYVASSNVEGPLGADSIASASYVDPIFISASAAASGFGSGGGSSTAATASLALTVSQSQAGGGSSGTGLHRVALLDTSDDTTPIYFDHNGITYNVTTNTLSVFGPISAYNITASLQGTASWATNAITASYALTSAGTVTNATSASFASTASYLNDLNQNLNIVGNLNVFGTASYSYVSASQLDVGTNTISVNVAEPAERFGGLIVYDSGSLSHQATASLFWDSLHNHWVYQNASGSTYSGGMFMSGPRNTGSLGDEPTLTKWFITRGDGGDHLNDTQIFSSGSVHIVTGSLTVTGDVVATASWANISISASTTSNTNSGTHRLVFANATPGSTPLYTQPFSATIDPSTGHITAIAFSGSFNGNLTGTASYATQALTASYALSSAGVAGGVTSIIAGSGISVDQSTGNVTVSATGGSASTGSLLVTASVSLNTITFTKGDGTTFPITVDTGSGGGGGGGLTFQQVQMIAFLGS